MWWIVYVWRCSLPQNIYKMQIYVIEVSWLTNRDLNTENIEIYFQCSKIWRQCLHAQNYFRIHRNGPQRTVILFFYQLWSSMSDIALSGTTRQRGLVIRRVALVRSRSTSKCLAVCRCSVHAGEMLFVMWTVSEFGSGGGGGGGGNEPSNSVPRTGLFNMTGKVSNPQIRSHVSRKSHYCEPC